MQKRRKTATQPLLSHAHFATCLCALVLVSGCTLAPERDVRPFGDGGRDAGRDATLDAAADVTAFDTSVPNTDDATVDAQFDAASCDGLNMRSCRLRSGCDWCADRCLAASDPRCHD